MGNLVHMVQYVATILIVLYSDTVLAVPIILSVQTVQLDRMIQFVATQFVHLALCVPMVLFVCMFLVCMVRFVHIIVAVCMVLLVAMGLLVCKILFFPMAWSYWMVRFFPKVLAGWNGLFVPTVLVVCRVHFVPTVLSVGTAHFVPTDLYLCTVHFVPIILLLGMFHLVPMAQLHPTVLYYHRVLNRLRSIRCNVRARVCVRVAGD